MRKADIPSDVRFRSVKAGGSTCSRRLLRYSGLCADGRSGYFYTVSSEACKAKTATHVHRRFLFRPVEVFACDKIIYRNIKIF